MASKDRIARCSRVVGVLGVILFLGASPSIGQSSGPSLPPESALQEEEWRVMDVFVQTYGSTDWSAVTAFLVANATYEGNPNIAFIPLSMGNVYLNRYEWRHDISDFEQALLWLEWVAGNHWLWGRRWLAAPIVSYLDISLVRLRRECPPAGYADRLQAVWQTALAITEEEADARLSANFPYPPYDSSETGDSKGEENAWEAGLLAAAANFLPDYGHAPAWEKKARQLAYDAITRREDPPDLDGVKTTTVADDFTLSNHGFFPNPTYAAATIELLLQAALPYQLAGRPVPPEFWHNLPDFYAVYKTYIDDGLEWVVPSDPEGRASLFPLALDPDLEDREVRCEADSGFLWRPAEPVVVMELGDPLWTAVLNSKVVMFYLMGSYLWHFPLSCHELTQE